jgi:protein-serine/threonine kinase
MTERNLLSYIRHPFIVRLHYAFQTQTCLVLVLQYCPGGNLASLIASEGRLQEQLVQLYMAEVFLAIECLHERNVVYRDLKPENVILDELGHAMLTDFGLSKEGVEGLQGTKSFCGSVAYLAPEILARKGHGPPVDIYGLGVLLYEMLAGRPPYYSRDRETLFRNIVSASLNVPSTASARAASLIHCLMQRDPAQRLGALQTSEIRKHLFFLGVDFDRVLKREIPVPPLRRHRRDGKSGTAESKDSGAKVSSPFEGRFESRVRRSWSSSTQDVNGWEFATANSRDGVDSVESLKAMSMSGTQRSRRTQRGPVKDWLAPTFF